MSVGRSHGGAEMKDKPITILLVIFILVLICMIGFAISRQQKESSAASAPVEFVVREIGVKYENPAGYAGNHFVKVLEITGHGKRCYVYAGQEFYTRTTLWCEDLQK